MSQIHQFSRNENIACGSRSSLESVELIDIENVLAGTVGNSCPKHLINAKKRKRGRTINQSKDGFEKGELLESNSSMHTWILRNFSKMSSRNSGDIYIRSPSFFFATSRWHLSLFAMTYFETRSFVVVLDGKMNREQVYWRLSLVCRDNTILKSVDGVHIFDRNLGAPRLLIKDSEINQEVFALHDCLILTCELHLKGDQMGANASLKTDLISRTDALSQNFMELLLSGEASDATIRVKERNFKVHRAILVARVPTFSSMFKHDMLEKISGLVEIDDCEPDIFFLFLTYVYSGMVKEVSPEAVISLYEVADKYQLNEMKTDCLELIKKNLSVKSFCNIMALALKYTENTLLSLAIDFFTNNVKNILVTVEWEKFMHKNHIQANELIIKAFEVLIR